MTEKDKNKKDKMEAEALKKTAKAYGTVSEEEVKEKFKNEEDISQELLEKEIEKEVEGIVEEEKPEEKEETPRDKKDYKKRDRNDEDRTIHLSQWV
ncbi:MAG: hypothetical protein Q8Q04_02295, partial [archaeon]|nr:hypothetical protein [archaeon]